MTNPKQTDLQKAVDNVNPKDLADNLANTDDKIATPAPLENEQTPPFIDESVRTGK